MGKPEVNEGRSQQLAAAGQGKSGGAGGASNFFTIFIFSSSR